MTDTADPADAPPKKGMMIPLVLGAILAVGGGAGGYWAVTQGPFAPTPEAFSDADAPVSEPTAAPVETSFVPLETVIISLGPDETGRHLIVTAELEVPPQAVEEVARLSPRVLDVMNSYLRVVSLSELSDPASLARLRAQMLRRIQVVTGVDRVKDLLITQFVVN